MSSRLLYLIFRQVLGLVLLMGRTSVIAVLAALVRQLPQTLRRQMST